MKPRVPKARSMPRPAPGAAESPPVGDSSRRPRTGQLAERHLAVTQPAAGHGFRPNYLSFAGTYQCNLNCPHCCVPIEWPDRLDIPTALRFLEQAHEFGIETLGFTGGEPFLYPEFVLTITRRAADLGFKFDKVMSNGVWFDDAGHLERVLGGLAEAGFRGKLGLSVDKFHGIQTAKAADFCRTARRVFGRDTIVSVSYASRSPDVGLEPVHKLARELGAVLDWSAVLGRYLLVSSELTVTVNWNHLAPVERAEKLCGAWDGQWFEEDYCEGPGQALIVTARGDVKPCCGFASDLDQLTIGNIYRDTVAEVVERGRSHPYVGTVFSKGLTAVRDEILARDPAALPAATSNHCFFCWYVLTKNLTAPATPECGRVSLPMAAAPGSWMSLVMMFDGRTVYLSPDPRPEFVTGVNRVYSIDVEPPLTEPVPDRLTWDEYQAWLDRLRGDGYRLTSRAFTPCRGDRPHPARRAESNHAFAPPSENTSPGTAFNS